MLRHKKPRVLRHNISRSPDIFCAMICKSQAEFARLYPPGPFMSSRRSFLATFAAVAAYLASPLRLLAQAAHRQGIPVFSPAALGAAQQGILTASRFEQLVGSSFRAYLDNDVVAEIVLKRVAIPTYSSAYVAAATTPPSHAPRNTLQTSPGSAKAKSARPVNCFYLTFNTGETYIPSDSYVLDHGILGSFTVGLAPGQSVPGDQRAIATFCTF